MKKIIVLLFLICAIPLSACSKAPEQIPAPTVQRLTSPLYGTAETAAGDAAVSGPGKRAGTFRQRGGRVCAGNPGRVSCTMMIIIFQSFLKL